MATHRTRLTFPEQLITRPIIFDMGRQFKVITNIRRADVGVDVGWVVGRARIGARMGAR